VLQLGLEDTMVGSGFTHFKVRALQLSYSYPPTLP